MTRNTRTKTKNTNKSTFKTENDIFKLIINNKKYTINTHYTENKIRI